MVFRFVRTITYHYNLATLVTPNGVITPENFDFKCAFGDVVKNRLRIKGTVVIPDPRMISTNNQVCASAILSEDCV